MTKVVLGNRSAVLVQYTFYSDDEGYAEILNQSSQYSFPGEPAYYPTHELRLLARIRHEFPNAKIDVDEKIPSEKDVIY